jgi:hypothetical protein
LHLNEPTLSVATSRALCKDSWNDEVRGNIKDLVQMDTSERMLQRAMKAAQSEEVKKLDCECLP